MKKGEENERKGPRIREVKRKRMKNRKMNERKGPRIRGGKREKE